MRPRHVTGCNDETAPIQDKRVINLACILAFRCQGQSMICSGVLIQTGGDDEVAHLRTVLRQDPRCCVGDSAGGVLAAVLEFPDFGAGRDLHDWLLTLPGVESVHVASIQYDDGGGELP